MPKQKQEPRAPGAALLKFTPGAVLLRAGVSRRLAGPQLLARVKDVCKGELEDPKGELTKLRNFNRTVLIWGVFPKTVLATWSAVEIELQPTNLLTW